MIFPRRVVNKFPESYQQTNDTCPHGCVYCYANFRAGTVKKRLALYDPASPILCDRIDPLNDKITDRSVKSMKAGKRPGIGYDQLSLF